MNIKPLFYLTTFLALTTSNAAAQMSEVRATSISRCFFVYAPMYEVSAKLGDSKLRSYATQRMMYLRGIMESSQSDPVFKRVFEMNLAKNKSAGTRIEDSLIEANRNRDAERYNRTMSLATMCDQELGLQPSK
jgi:hypothetical protein